MGQAADHKPGVWNLLKRCLDASLAAVQNRVEIFALELQVEKCRLVEAMLCAAAVAALGMMTLTLVTFTVVVVFWENARLPVLGGLSLLYLLGTVWAWRALQVRLRSQTAFVATLEELKQDRECLRTDQ